MMDDDLLDNHLAFLAAHRGQVTATDIGYALVSARPEFTYGIAVREGGIDAGLRTIHRPEQSRLDRAQLRDLGFRHASTLTYMTRSTLPSEGEPATDLRVSSLSTLEDADLFADVQTEGFFDEEEARAEWLPYMREAARRNLGSATQTFYLARAADGAAAVALTVETSVLGIYAVATPARYRRRGLGTALLHAALGAGSRRGVATATLQVVAGSYAEDLYTKLGFRARFASEVWRRE